MPQIEVDKSFLHLSDRLDLKDRGRVMDFLTKFYGNPANPGCSLERVTNAKSPNVWSARITQSLRAILYREGDRFSLLYAGRHDDAYDWAARRRIEQHPATQTLQIVEVPETVASVIEDPPRMNKVEAPPGLFDAHGDDYLFSLGVPRDWLPVLRKVDNEAKLWLIVEKLPEEVGERLVALAAGELVTPPAPARVASEARADERRRFFVVEDAADLVHLLEQPLADWMRFLHPSQRSMVEGSFNGPVKVTGSAGTGKTVVAMHRARAMARQGHRVLLTSFVTTLVSNIERNLKDLCTEEERSRIQVSTVLSAALSIARQAGFEGGPATDAAIEKAIEKLQPMRAPGAEPPFLMSEWTHVISNQGITSWDEYRTAKRTGRGRAGPGALGRRSPQPVATVRRRPGRARAPRHGALVRDLPKGRGRSPGRRARVPVRLGHRR